LPVNRGFFVETERRPAGGTKEEKCMKLNRKLAARFAPETRFEVQPAPAAPFRATRENELERLKNELLWEKLEEAVGADMNARLRRAANDAAALAWTTSVPLLVFPALFEEKAHLAFRQAARQESIRERSRELLAA
jgi:hypothetical protein